MDYYLYEILILITLQWLIVIVLKNIYIINAVQIKKMVFSYSNTSHILSYD